MAELPSLWWQDICLNNQVAPFNNKAIQQALWYAVDWTAIQAVVHCNQGAVA